LAPEGNRWDGANCKRATAEIGIEAVDVRRASFASRRCPRCGFRCWSTRLFVFRLVIAAPPPDAVSELAIKQLRHAAGVDADAKTGVDLLGCRSDAVPAAQA
jgi:hypothetical protein